MTSIAQRLVLIGLETTPGTGVNVDVALHALASLRAVPNKIVPNEHIGSFAPQRHYIGSSGAEGELTIDGYYQHAPYPVSMALGAGAVVTTGDPEAWTFTLPMAATAPTFATYSMEYADNDGGDHIVRALDVFGTALEISGEAGQAWQFKTTLTGGQTTLPADITATPTPTAHPYPILMADTALKWADDGDFESAVAAAALISFNWKVEGLQHSKLFAGSLYPSGRGHNMWDCTLEMIVECSNATAKAQRAKLLNVSQTAIQIRAEAADAGGAGVDWYAELRGVYMLQSIDTLDERDGNNTLKFTYKGEKDWEIGAISSTQILIGNDLQSL
jgi:hypothetical protein